MTSATVSRPTTTTTTSYPPPPITIQPVLPTDYPTLARLAQTSFRPSPINRAMFPTISEQDFAAYTARLALSASKPHVKLVKAVSPENEIVGVAEWEFYTEDEGLPASPKEQRDHWSDGANNELCNVFFGGMDDARMEAMAGKRCLILQLLAVHPSHQGKGIGSLLLQDGLAEADKLRLPVWLEGSSDGRRLYSKFGFKDFRDLRIDLREWGGEGEDVHVCMLRDPPAARGMEKTAG